MAGQKNPSYLITAPSGIDVTTDPAHLPQNLCLAADNLLADRASLLRGQIQYSNLCSAVTFANGFQEVALWLQNYVQFSIPNEGGACANSYYTPTAAGNKVVVVSGGICYYSTTSPSGTPPTVTNFSVANNQSGGTTTFPATGRIRSVQMQEDLILTGGGVNPTTGHALQPQRFVDNSTFANYLFQLGMCPPAVLTVTTFNFIPTGSGLLNGTYIYATTFVDEQGRESSPSYQPAVSVTNQQVHITSGSGWPGATDPQIVSMNVYRNTAGGDVWYLVGNTNTTGGGTVNSFSWNDNIADNVLNAGAIAPNAGENDVPNPATWCLAWQGRVVMNDLTVAGGIQISNANSASQFCTDPTINPNGLTSDGTRLADAYAQGTSIIMGALLGDSLALFHGQGIDELYGNDPGNYFIRPIHQKVCVAADSVQRCNNVVIFLCADGVYALDYATGFQVMLISQPLTYVILNTSGAALSAAQSAYYNNAYYLRIGSVTYRYDLTNQTWTTMSTSFSWDVFHTIRLAGQSDYIYIGSTSAQVIEVLTTWPTLGLTGPTLTYETPPVGNRVSQMRVAKVRLYGTGTIGAGSTVALNLDYGQKTTGPQQIIVNGVNVMAPSDTNQGCLLDWSPGDAQNATTGYLASVRFVIANPIDVILSDVRIDWMSVED